MGRQKCLVGLAVAAIMGTFASSSVLWSDDWEADEAPYIGEMTSETEIPLNDDKPQGTPDTRTTIGIAEKVTCSIDEATFLDKDCNLTTQQIDCDTIGTRTWSKTGTQAANCTLSDPVDDSVVLTASESAGAVTVKVIVKDSQTRPNASEQTERTKQFTILAPNGEDAEPDQEQGWNFVAGNDRVGAQGEWAYRVLPDTVSFKHAKFKWVREAQVFDKWPNGGNHTIAADTGNSMVNKYNYFCFEGEAPDHFKWHEDEGGPRPKAILMSGGQYQNYTYTVHIKAKYQNAADQWVEYKDRTLSVEYQASNLKCRLKFLDESAEVEWQGPWADPE